MQLGPHDDYGQTIPPKKRRSLGSFVPAKLHTFSSALILIALVSFSGNLAFAYMSFVKQGLDPEIIPQQLGSDDAESHVPVISPSVHFKSIEKPAALTLTAQSYLVADAETGEIILEKDADKPYPMASVSKLLTAIVAREQIDSRHIATVSKNSYNTYGSEGDLSSGEKILVSDLYYPLLIESSNDAAEVLADDFGREKFMTLINQKAAALGMYSTSYEDPSGLSPLNVSTSHDLAMLGLHIYAEYPELLDITRIKEYSIYSHAWANSNVFLTYPNFLGGKNGFTNEARRSTLSFFKVFLRGSDENSKAESRPLLIVLLRSSDRDKDVSALLSFVTRNIRYESDISE